jgi:hypothetical protein
MQNKWRQWHEIPSWKLESKCKCIFRWPTGGHWLWPCGMRRERRMWFMLLHVDSRWWTPTRARRKRLQRTSRPLCRSSLRTFPNSKDVLFIWQENCTECILNPQHFVLSLTYVTHPSTGLIYSGFRFWGVRPEHVSRQSWVDAYQSYVCYDWFVSCSPWSYAGWCA